MKRFSKQFRTFAAWRRNRRATPYVKRISRLHGMYSHKMLAELRTPLDISLKPYAKLTATEGNIRKQALGVLSQMRKGSSRTTAAKQEGISSKELQRHAGRYLYKKGHRWLAKSADRIQRWRWFYSKGKRIGIIVKNSRDGSRISKYLNAVKFALQTGNAEFLKSFKLLKIVDAAGKIHRFEIRLKKLYELAETIENDEQRQIYDDQV